MAFYRRSDKCKFRFAFSQQLAAASGASHAFVGFFDTANEFFVDCWMGERDGGVQPSVSPAVRHIVGLLKSTDVKEQLEQAVFGPAEAALDPDTVVWVKRDKCILGAGGRVGHLVAVAGILFERGTLEKESPELLGLLQMAVTYAVQELHQSRGDKALYNKGHIAEHVLGRLSFNFVVVDVHGEIVYMTENSATWLAEAMELGVVNGRLVAGSKGDQKTLTAALHAAVSPEAERSVLQVEAEVGPPQIIVVLPIRTSSPHALVIFGREKDDTSLSELLLETYGLTRAERRLTLQLLCGKTITEAAQSVNLTTSTARSYLKSIFTKTGSHRQSELISLCYSLMPPLKSARSQPDPVPQSEL